MSVVTEHLQQQGSDFEVVAHRQAYTCADEARALGIDAGEVLKTVAVRVGGGYALMVIPASRRLDLHLVREAGALPPLGALVSTRVYVDPEVLGHETVAFAAGTQTESVKMRTQDLFGGAQVATMRLAKRAHQDDDDPVA